MGVFKILTLMDPLEYLRRVLLKRVMRGGGLEASPKCITNKTTQSHPLSNKMFSSQNVGSILLLQ